MVVPSRPIPAIARTIQACDIQTLFQNAHFPTYRRQLVEYAREHLASADLLAVLDSLPDRIYHSPDEVYRAIQDLGR